MQNKKIILLIFLVIILLVGGFLLYENIPQTNKKYLTINASVDSARENVLEENNAVLPAQNNNTQDDTNNISDNTISSKENNTNPVQNTDTKNSPKIIEKLVSWGFQESNARKIDTIIIHSTYNALGGDEFDLNKILAIYKSYGVSPHYIIDRGGNIYQLVMDKNIAYHAGESQMPDGRTNVNNFSLGIELINDKVSSPTDQQYAALKNLLSQLKNKYAIKYVFGHNQIAPGRKDDPWNFNWNEIKIQSN